MKKLFISAFAMLAVALGFTACSSEDELVKETPAQGQKVTVIATTEEPAQRTALEQDGDKYKVVWSEDDKIKLIDASSNFTEFTLKNEYANQSTGEFTGTVTTAGTYTAYYPSTYDGSTWPAAQTYVANNIPLGVPMKATGIIVEYGEGPMISPISFKNEGGILRLNLKGTAKVKSITVSATGLDAITLNCGEGVQLDETTATPFHIAVPGTNGTEEQPGTAYSGLKIEITDDAGKVCTKTLKSDKTITVKRSMITDINLTAGNFVTPVPTTGAAEATIGGVKTNVKWVQLWEGGLKFAEYNVGAANNKPEDFGGFYTWGGSVNNDKTATGYTGSYTDDHNTGTDNLTGEYDTATKLWGSNWRMLTQGEIKVIFNDNVCEAEWIDGTTKKFNETTVPGLLLKGKEGTAYQNNSVFLPSAGSYNSNGRGVITNRCNYWTSTNRDAENSAYCLSAYLSAGVLSAGFTSGTASTSYSVRAVLNEPK